MYRLAPKGVIRISDGKLLLPDLSSQDWLDYLAWLAGGGVLEPMVI